MLSNVTKKFVAEAKELKTELVSMMFDSDMLKSMEAREFMFMKRVMSMFDSSIEIMNEQAKMMDEMNKKLDLLIEKK